MYPNSPNDPQFQPVQEPAPEQKKHTALIAIGVVVLLVAAIAGYFIYSNSQNGPGQKAPVTDGTDKTAPDFSTVKTADMTITDLTKAKMQYTLSEDAINVYTADRQEARTEKLKSGTLVPLQDFKLEKKQGENTAFTTTFFVYELKNGLENANVADIMKQRDEFQKEQTVARGGTLTFATIGTPPTITIKTTDDRTAILASLKRTATYAGEGSQRVYYAVNSSVRLGSKLFVANYITPSAEQFASADADFQAAINQLQLKLGN
ncbi:MAG TPA: hypothetical protein VFZ48_02630 [Candidatus Saccharimonadales bacterium]